MYAEASPSDRRFTLSAFDGGFDYAGTSGVTFTASPNRSAGVILADATLLAALTGPGNVNLRANAGAQVGWSWSGDPTGARA